MPAHGFDPEQSLPPVDPPSGDQDQPNGAGTWRPPWRRPEPDHPDHTPPEPSERQPSPTAPPDPAEAPYPRQVAPGVVETGSRGTHLYGAVDVVAGEVRNLILETRKRDVLEGVELDRAQIRQEPFVCEGEWAEAWQQALDPHTRYLRQRVLIVVAPRSSGATTFAQHLLAEHAPDKATLCMLDADWNAPTRGRLPLELNYSFQLDLKEPAHDRPTADFLTSLTQHAEHLETCHSYLVLTVAQELWDTHYLGTRDGLHVVHLKQPPDAQQVVDAHLRARGYVRLADDLRSFDKARACLRDLDAVAAIRAVGTITAAWQEHIRLQRQPSTPQSSGAAQQAHEASFESRVTAALSDWRGDLDRLFGEATATHNPQGPSLTSLTLEDRCLLLALAVRQSAPMPKIAATAQKLQQRLASDGPGDAHSPAQSAFAGRGLRRRICDVGADVDTHDGVLFNRPAYGRAVLEYVWDNYEVMRKHILEWLVHSAEESDADPASPIVDSLAALTLRHGAADHLIELGELAHSNHPDLLSAVLGTAVRDEHVGRLAWATLYRWAEQAPYAKTVISTCRRVLHDPCVTSATAKRAMVRLRRIVHTTGDPAARREVLKAFTELTHHPAGTDRLVGEVRNWQQSKAPASSGSLAFMALMSVPHPGPPWLISDAAPDGIDIERALQQLLGDPGTASEVIPRLAEWIRSCADDAAAYGQLRDQLVPPLRGHDMFQAGMELMQALTGIPTPQGASVAQDFYQHLVDPRLQKVFSLEGGPA